LVVPLRRTPLPEWAITRRRELGQRLATARRTAGLSQDDVADRIGVERRSIQRYESGERDPRYTDLLLIADALDIDLADLVRT
jgi:transcriptional regulator with XRE-family HTH domain